MSDEQIRLAARLWRQGLDTYAIAKVIFGTVYSHLYVDGAIRSHNYEATIYNNLGQIRRTK